jgi:hypothetical protein
VYKITPAANLDGGKITAATEEAVAGLPTRLVIEPTVVPAASLYYGVDEGRIYINNTSGNSLGIPVTRVEDAAGIQYDFVMPNQDVIPTASFFRLKGTVQVAGAGYKPVKIEAFEEGADYEWLPIAESASFGLPTADYAWTIDPKSYVYLNNGSTTGGTRNVIFRITLTSTDGKITYPYTVKRSISNLYNESNYPVYIPVNTLSNVYAKESTTTSITLSWDQAAWAVGGYQVYRYDGSSYVKVGNVIALNKTQETAEYTDATLQSAYSYSYRVVGIINTEGTEGTQSSTINEKTRYQAPASVNGYFNDGYSLQNYIYWAQVPYGQNSDSVYYDVYRNGEYIANTSSLYYYDSYASNSWDFNTTYQYTIVARGSDGRDSVESTASASIKTPYITDISAYNDSENYISSGDYQYYRVNDAQSWYSSLFYLNYTNADIYVALVRSSSYEGYYSYSSGSSDYSFSMNSSNSGPVIVVVRGVGTSGSYSFTVQQPWW